MTTTEPATLAALIEGRRKREEKSARELALAAGVSPTYWRDVERGMASPSPEVAARMAEVLWITPGELKAVGFPEAAAELDRRLDTRPQDEISGDVRALVEKIGRSRSLTERQKRALAARIMQLLGNG